MRRKAEAVGPNHRARMNDATFTNAASVRHGHTRRQTATCANNGIHANDAVLGNMRPFSHHCTRSNADKRPDGHIGCEGGLWVNHCTRMNTRYGSREMRALP